jgi:hypothetical protein
MDGNLRLVGIRSWRFGAILGVIALVLLILSSSARAAGEYEPNDSRDTSSGPLAGGTWYTASFETDNDVDWYVFYIKTYSQMDFSAGLVSTCSNCVNEPVLTLYDKDGRFIDDFYSGELNEVRHLYLTLTPGRYYFEVNYADTGDRYKFRIDPAASITTSRECGEAIVAKEAVVPQLAEVNQDLAKKAEEVAAKATVVHEAKQELGRASNKAQRLRAKVKRLHRLHRPGWYVSQIRAKLRQARSEVQNAVEELARAQEERQPVWEEKRNLEALAGQRQQEITNAEGQIAAHC